MKTKPVNKRLKREMSVFLEPLGFEAKDSVYCTFYRKCNDIYHFIMPDVTPRGWYDIKVFAASPLTTPTFDTLFPDGIGIPIKCPELHPVSGVGFRQYMFYFDRDHKYDEDAFKASFEIAKRSILDHAVPYLDKIKDFKDMVPLVVDQYIGLTLFYAGEVERSIPYLLKERERCFRILSREKDVDNLIGDKIRIVENCLTQAGADFK